MNWTLPLDLHFAFYSGATWEKRQGAGREEGEKAGCILKVLVFFVAWKTNGSCWICNGYQAISIQTRSIKTGNVCSNAILIFSPYIFYIYPSKSPSKHNVYSEVSDWHLVDSPYISRFTSDYFKGISQICHTWQTPLDGSSRQEETLNWSP